MTAAPIVIGEIERCPRSEAALTPIAAEVRKALRRVGLSPRGDRPPGDWPAEVSWAWDCSWTWPTFAPRARPFDWAIDEVA